jgi:replicative superfamily II helicase
MKLAFKEVGCVVMDRIDLAHDRDRRQALQIDIMNLKVT